MSYREVDVFWMLHTQERLREAKIAFAYLNDLPWRTFREHRLLIAAGAVFGQIKRDQDFLAEECAGWFDNSAFDTVAQRRAA